MLCGLCSMSAYYVDTSYMFTVCWTYLQNFHSQHIFLNCNHPLVFSLSIHLWQLKYGEDIAKAASINISILIIDPLTMYNVEGVARWTHKDLPLSCEVPLSSMGLIVLVFRPAALLFSNDFLLASCFNKVSAQTSVAHIQLVGHSSVLFWYSQLPVAYSAAAIALTVISRLHTENDSSHPPKVFRIVTMYFHQEHCFQRCIIHMCYLSLFPKGCNKWKTTIAFAKVDRGGALW